MNTSDVDLMPLPEAVEWLDTALTVFRAHSNKEYGSQMSIDTEQAKKTANAIVSVLRSVKDKP